MTKEYKIENIKNLELNFEGNANVTFTKSIDYSLSILVEYEDDLIFKDSSQDDIFALRIEKPKDKNILDIFNNISNVTDLIKNLYDMKEEYGVMNIHIKLPISLDSFIFKQNNGLLTFEYLNTKSMTLKGNNLHINMLNNIIFTDGNIKINNANIDMILSHYLNNLDIKVNTGNLSFIREKDAKNLGIKYKGNHITTEGVLETAHNVVSCRLNSGVIKVK